MRLERRDGWSVVTIRHIDLITEDDDKFMNSWTRKEMVNRRIVNKRDSVQMLRENWANVEQDE